MRNKKLGLVAAVALLGACGKKNDEATTSTATDVSSLPSKVATGALALSLKLAEEATPDNDPCMKAFQTVLDGKPKKGDWKNGVLDHLQDTLYRVNGVETADVELVFCRLAKIGVDPDLANLPQTISKEDPFGSTISVTVSKPDETFAETNGYVAKAEVSSGSTKFLTIWWQGSGSESKGFLIQGSNPMQKDGNQRLRYVQWDRTGETQVVKMMATQFAESYLKTAAGAKESKTGGDNAVFAQVSYNTSTKAVDAKSVEIRQGNSDATKDVFKCARTLFTGTLGGKVSGYRPAKGTPEEVTETATGGESKTGGLGMDGEKNITDSKDTADHAGDPVPGSDVAAETFAYSCNDLNNADAAGKFFANDTVDFTKTPGDVFPK